MLNFHYIRNLYKISYISTKMHQKQLFNVIILSTMLILSQSIYIITNFGAIPYQDHQSVHETNAKAFLDAVIKANSTLTGERIVKVPKGIFYSFPMRMNNIQNVTILIEGKLSASKLIKGWPRQDKSGYYEDFISCHSCSYLTIHGGGKIDGRGYHWWLVSILNDQKLLPDNNYRPHLIRLQKCTNIVIHDILMKNSPQFHLKMDECYDAQIYNIAIKVNTTAQFDLLKKYSLSGILPLFPLNTDGIDPSGARMHIYNITVQNYDDVVVPKPSHQGYMDGNCTRDMLIENATVVLGVGMSIGSVPPDRGCNCIRNITFRNVNMIRPFKGIYVKTNPGDEGTGLVENIYYHNFEMDRPIWWAIYIGPQQMKQPDGDGPGCMLYPFDRRGTCTTQPRVTLRNITLENVNIKDSLLYPVTIRCNVSNPCQHINFIRVRTNKWSVGQKQNGYVCQYASGVGEGNVPNIRCLSQKRNGRQLHQENNGDYDQGIGKGKNSLQYEHDELTWIDYVKLLDEMEKAVKEIGYIEEDDQFDYNFNLTEHYPQQQVISVS